jgi:hypothetical protein
MGALAVSAPARGRCAAPLTASPGAPPARWRHPRPSSLLSLRVVSGTLSTGAQSTARGGSTWPATSFSAPRSARASPTRLCRASMGVRGPGRVAVTTPVSAAAMPSHARTRSKSQPPRPACTRTVAATRCGSRSRSGCGCTSALQPQGSGATPLAPRECSRGSSSRNSKRARHDQARSGQARRRAARLPAPPPRDAAEPHEARGNEQQRTGQGHRGGNGTDVVGLGEEVGAAASIQSGSGNEIARHADTG